MIFAVSRPRPVAALALLASCSPASDEPRTVTISSAAAAKPATSFVGTIRLLERTYVLGIRTTAYVTLTFDGPRLRREVRPGGFADSTERYGLLADLRTDSVTYYVQDATLNAHCRLASPDYRARVAANEPILASLDRKPYSTIFAPLPPATPALHPPAPAALGQLTDCRAVLFLLPDQSRCEAFYSEQVRVPTAALAYIEHHAPAALPSLALAVHYTPPPRPTGGLLDRLHQGLKDSFAQQTEFDSFDHSVAPRAFELPAGSRAAGSAADLEETLRAASGSSHRHHHH